MISDRPPTNIQGENKKNGGSNASPLLQISVPEVADRSGMIAEIPRKIPTTCHIQKTETPQSPEDTAAELSDLTSDLYS
jgi:hypothetical protein